MAKLEEKREVRLLTFREAGETWKQVRERKYVIVERGQQTDTLCAPTPVDHDQHYISLKVISVHSVWNPLQRACVGARLSVLIRPTQNPYLLSPTATVTHKHSTVLKSLHNITALIATNTWPLPRWRALATHACCRAFWALRSPQGFCPARCKSPAVKHTNTSTETHRHAEPLSPIARQMLQLILKSLIEKLSWGIKTALSTHNIISFIKRPTPPPPCASLPPPPPPTFLRIFKACCRGYSFGGSRHAKWR